MQLRSRWNIKITLSYTVEHFIKNKIRTIETIDRKRVFQLADSYFFPGRCRYPGSGEAKTFNAQSGADQSIRQAEGISNQK